MLDWLRDLLPEPRYKCRKGDYYKAHRKRYKVVRVNHLDYLRRKSKGRYTFRYCPRCEGYGECYYISCDIPAYDDGQYGLPSNNCHIEQCKTCEGMGYIKEKVEKPKPVKIKKEPKPENQKKDLEEQRILRIVFREILWYERELRDGKSDAEIDRARISRIQLPLTSDNYKFNKYLIMPLSSLLDIRDRIMKKRIALIK